MPRRRSTPALVAALLLALCGCGTTPEAGPAARDGAVPATRPSASRPARIPGVSPTSAPPTRLELPDPAPAPRLPIDAPLLGGDLSWPQCPKGLGIPQKRSLGSPLPTADAEFVVIGLTNGPGFVRNPCLPGQVAFAEQRHLLAAAYAVASYPDDATVATYGGSGPFGGRDRLAALANTGYQQARFNVTSLLLTDLDTPIVWVDVESVPDFDWSPDLAANAAVLRGVVRGYRDAGYRVGVYSTPYLYASVVGDLSLGDDVPEWRAAGHTSQAEAVTRCGPEWSIQGGTGVLGQWADDLRDLDLTCPGVDDVGDLFVRL